jgi:hypothetical protein
MVMVDDHSVVRGLALNGHRLPVATTAPMIVARTDKEFIAGVLRDLQEAPDSLSDPRGVTFEGGHLKLYQPVHQVFHLAIVQIDCDSFGGPRLDPKKIDSMGLVVRRLSTVSPGVNERWSKQGSSIQGWVPCVDDGLDPDPARRRPAASSGNAFIDQRLPISSPAYAPYSESVAPLYLAPPDICKAIKATVLYGLIPVTSVEKSEIVPESTYDSKTVQQHLPQFLQLSTTGSKSRAIVPANAVITYVAATDSFLSSDPNADPAQLPAALSTFLTVLRQFEFELNAFGDTPEATALFAALNQFKVQDKDGKDLAKLGDFMKNAAKVLVEKRGGSVHMPAQWPDLHDDQSTAIAALVQKAMESRLKGLMAGEGRYEALDRQYCLRAFVRVKRPDGCPPVLVWSAPSAPFTIAPWYETSGLPPVKIQLPKMDMDALKKLKPNVAFAMPESLFNDLQRDGKKIMKGESTSPGGSSLGLMWICGFNIPVITICAFIVLNIFLSLFDLFLHWMMFIKICLPIPVPKKN